MTLSIIIPAYNEARTIEELLRRVLALEVAGGKEVIVIDDGSRDETAALAEQFAPQVTVLRQEKNRGKGAAVRAGFARARGDYVVVQDADLEYDPHDLLTMLALAQEKNLPVVYGSRRLPMSEGQERGHWLFYLGGLGVTWATNMLYGSHLTDEPTCYKMVRRDVLEHIELEADGFEFCPEITAKILKLGVPIIELPIHYHPRSAQEGKKIKWKDGFIALWTLLKNRF